MARKKKIDHTHRTQTIIGLTSERAQHPVRFDLPTGADKGSMRHDRDHSGYEEDSFQSMTSSGSSASRFDYDSDSYSYTRKRNDRGNYIQSSPPRRFCSKRLLFFLILIILGFGAAMYFLYDANVLPGWMMIFGTKEIQNQVNETSPVLLSPSSIPSVQPSFFRDGDSSSLSTPTAKPISPDSPTQSFDTPTSVPSSVSQPNQDAIRAPTTQPTQKASNKLQQPSNNTRKPTIAPTLDTSRSPSRPIVEPFPTSSPNKISSPSSPSRPSASLTTFPTTSNITKDPVSGIRTPNPTTNGPRTEAPESTVPPATKAPKAPGTKSTKAPRSTKSPATKDPNPTQTPAPKAPSTKGPGKTKAPKEPTTKSPKDPKGTTKSPKRARI